MDYELIVSALQKASAFDLYRLQSAIGHLLDDPLRLSAIKRQLRPGMGITYFEPQENRLIPAQVLEMRRTRVAIQELQTGKRWTVPLYMINIEGTDYYAFRLRVSYRGIRESETEEIVLFSSNPSEDPASSGMSPRTTSINTVDGGTKPPYA